MRETLVKTEEFKHSLLGRIPKDWKIGKLSDLAINHDGKRIPLKQSDRDKMEGIYPYYGASGVIDWVDNYLFEGDYVLLGEDGENVVSRQLPLAFRASGKFWVNNHAHIYEPLPNVDIRFLTVLLEHTDYSPLISGSAQPKLTQEALNRLYLRIPPPEEQKSIAEILDTIDSTIAHTSSLIAKLKQMKAGLLHDLLTRGLDENGELRDAIGHPEQFKDSPLGRIPKDWEVKSLAEISRQITDGVHATPNYTSAGIPFISVNNLVGNCISFDSCQFISEAEHEILIQRCHPEQGDILLGKVATLGVVDVVLTDRKFSIFVQVALVKLKAGLIPKFIKYSITHQYLQDQIQQKASGTTIRYIGVEMIGKLLVKVPSKKEQESIAAILDTHDTRIGTEEAYRNKLKLQKKGLMHDLLTGKVRVKDADKFTPASDTV
jgi:type I restriction enzyme S subunit